MISFGKYMVWKALVKLIKSKNIDAKLFKHHYGLKNYHKICKGDISKISEEDLIECTATIIFVNLYYELADE